MAKIKGLYCILPEFDTIKEYKKFVEKLCKFRPDIVQLRIKNKPDKFFYNTAVEIKKILAKHKITFIINDRLDIAISINVNGVHLGQDDLPVIEARRIVQSLKLKNFIIGHSTHSVEQAKKALNLPVDYIAIGPVFETTTKSEYKPIGLEVVRKVKLMAKEKNIPVVAIGGINHENIELVKNTNVDTVAVISVLKDLNKKVIEKLKVIK